MKRWRRFTKRVSKFTKQPRLARYYLITAVSVLIVSTIAWAWVGSFIELGNADQLANTFITQHLSTALFPDQHTFLFKLPFFWLVNMLGATPFAFCFVTILVTLLTVSLFAVILYKIEKRPLYIGTIFLALALVLMMVPAQSYAGASLPVNMAMLTTRNLEYILYIVALILILGARRWKSSRLAIAVLVLVALFASDKLFLSISIGSAILLCIISLFWHRTLLRSLALKWFTVSIIGAVGATLLLFGLSSIGWLQSVGQGSVGPYGLVHDVKSFIQAVVYAILSLLTNFGANPGFDGRTIPSLITLGLGRLSSPLIIVYAMTIIIFICVVIATTRIIKDELKKITRKKKEVPVGFGLTLMLVVSTTTALGLYTISNHYYPVDSRYVSIALFAGFVGVTSYGKTVRKLYRNPLFFSGIVLVMGIILSSIFLSTNLYQQNQATNNITQRNKLIAQTLKLHPVDTLLGDYWRVMPIKLTTPNSRQIIDPLASCSTVRQSLTNTAWIKGDTARSFAYLLTLGPISQNFGACTLAQVIAAYGKPDSSVVISGTEKEPQEVLLFYNKGVRKITTPTTNTTNLTDTVIPIPLSSLPFTTCKADTVMNIVAHEDDDILFMNPNILHEIKAGNCIRTVYITAGDAGSNGPYWIGRQTGAEAAYASMFGLTDQSWTERRIILSPTETITVANPRGLHNVSLIFMHLPDGSPNGHGFAHSNYESLMKLYNGTIDNISTVDGSSTYTSSDLTNGLQSLINAYKPAKIQSQSIQNGGRYTDHSDHTAVGLFVQRVVAAHNLSNPNQLLDTTYYLGYPIHAMPENVSADDFDAKTKTFLTYSQFDSGSCHSLDECDNAAVYGFYLRRQYTAEQ